jgi:hypothetical protein
MRLVLAIVLAGLVALPLSASAQDDEAHTTPEPNLQEPAPASEPAPEEPALQIELDPAGVEIVPSPPRTPDGYTLEEAELRVKRAKTGYGISIVVASAGLVMGITAGIAAYGESFSPSTPPPGWTAPVGWTGVALLSGGVAGAVASGVLMRRRKRSRDSLRYAHYGTPRRVQWDLARSRLVF